MDETLIVFLETNNEKNILSALRRAAKSNINKLNTHIIYAGQHNLDLAWDSDVLQRIVDTDLNHDLTMTFIYMYRDLLITKEKVNRICTGKSYRQKDHETPTGGDTYKDSVADDLELLFEDIKLGKSPLSIAWTYYAPELTLKEMDLVDKKDPDYFRTFKWLNNADVIETEMNLSTSTSKYVSAYCRRRTIEIKPNQESNANRKSNSLPAKQQKNNNSSNVTINIAETEFGTEEKSLLGEKETAEQKATPISDTLLEDFKDKLLENVKQLDWRLFCALMVLHIVIGVVLGGIIVELFIHKAPTTTQRSTTSTITAPSILSATTTTPSTAL